MKKVVKVSQRTFLPFLVPSDLRIYSIAIKSGTKATSNNGAVNEMGGHANHSKNAVVRASL